MPGESPTKWQAQAYRFGVRRLESAVSSGDPLLRGDPMRRRLNVALIVSFILAALILGGFAVYGFIRPQPKIGSAAVVIDQDTGGAFVSRGGVLYPAMNLASARLAAGRGQNGNNAPSTTTVDTATIGKQPRGPLLGIPGAPNVLPTGSHLIAPLWTVCDDTRSNPALPPNSAPIVRTTAILGEPAPTNATIGSADAMLVTPDAGKSTFLVWAGRRSQIDPTDPTIRLAFGLGTRNTPRPISAALLNIIPQGPDIVVPSIALPTTQPPYATALGVHVGEVFGLKRADRSSAIYVALPDGYQQITALVGDLIRDYLNQSKQVPLVEPVLLRQAPRTTRPIELSTYPARRPMIHGYSGSPTACVSRVGTDPATTRVYALHSVPVPSQAKPVSVTKPGDLTVDAVYLHPGDGAVFSSSTERGGVSRALFVVTDDGVAYPVVSGPALISLGYTAKDVKDTAPQLLSLLPQGPTLDPDTAVHFYPQTGISASSLPSPSSAGASPSG